MSKIRAIVDEYVPLQGLFDKPLVIADGTEVGFEPTAAVGGAAAAAARMLRLVPGFDFEIGELPIVNYLSARDTGIPISAIPVFLTRRFVHGLVFSNRESGITDPHEFEGKRVGCGYWGHTDTTWARGVLAEEYGVDLDKITWVTYNEEQVPKAVLPSNLVHIPRLNLEQMMLTGEIAGEIVHHGKSVEPTGDDAIGRLIPDWEEAEKTWFTKTGLFPILHVVVIKNSVLEEHPSLAGELYAAFEGAKANALARVARGDTFSAAETASAIKSGFPVPELSYLGADPLPYGLEPNRENLETLVRMASNQHVLSGPVKIDDVFLDCE